MDSARLRVAFVPGYRARVGTYILHIISGLIGTGSASLRLLNGETRGAPRRAHLWHLPRGRSGAESATLAAHSFTIPRKRVIYVECAGGNDPCLRDDYSGSRAQLHITGHST